MPLFLTKNVVMADSGTNLFSNCRTLGFQCAFYVGNVLQVYGPFVVDTAGVFGPGYTGTMAHEVGEAINDPNTGNATPPWGAEGQVPVGSCQANFEVGDPLSPGQTHPGSKDRIVSGANGLTVQFARVDLLQLVLRRHSLGSDR
jgi:hypothetical protein